MTDEAIRKAYRADTNWTGDPNSMLFRQYVNPYRQQQIQTASAPVPEPTQSMPAASSPVFK